MSEEVYLNVAQKLWETGSTARYHAEPIQPQSVADHAWGVALLLTQLAPRELVTKELLTMALLHDAPEKDLGDVPYTAKKYHPTIKAAHDYAEMAWFNDAGLGDLVLGISGEQKKWLKCCDMLELVLYCDREWRKGNGFALVVRNRGIAALLNGKDCPVAVQHVISSLR